MVLTICLTLTLNASMTSLKFLFPRILFFIALTASLGLQTEQHHNSYVRQCMLYNLETQSTIQLNELFRFGHLSSLLLF